jgi:hypothetical protein
MFEGSYKLKSAYFSLVILTGFSQLGLPAALIA